MTDSISVLQDNYNLVIWRMLIPKCYKTTLEGKQYYASDEVLLLQENGDITP